MIRLSTLAVAAVLAGSATADARPDLPSLAAGLQSQAPAVLAHVKKKGFTNVGVLKFLVRRGDNPPSDAGDLTLSLANKTEVALILANTDESFGIIDKASEFVDREKMTAANHLTADGRKAFFTRRFELAWSRDKVEPSGFVTGVVTLAPDLKRVTVRFQVFDKTGAIEDVPGEVAALTDPETLAEAGHSFAISPARQKVLVAGGPAPDAETLRAEAVDGALKAAAPTPDDTCPQPFAPLTDSPIRWKILYDGKPVTITGGKVPEPRADERVEFVLANPGTGTYAAVLLVNGENTLYQEHVAPLACRKWVLGPGAEVTVRGFQTDADTAVPFRVLRPEEPEPDVVRYGREGGTYRLVVFHGALGAGGPMVGPTGRSDATSLAIARTRGGTRPTGVKPQSLRALQAELRGRAQAAEGARGYVVKGGKAEHFETENVTFTPSTETPVADISLRYINPKN